MKRQTAFLPYGVKFAKSDQEEQRHAILCEGMEQHVWHLIAGAEVSVIQQTRGRISERLASKAKPYLFWGFV